MCNATAKVLVLVSTENTFLKKEHADMLNIRKYNNQIQPTQNSGRLIKTLSVRNKNIMAISPIDVREIPNVAWEYWGWIETLLKEGVPSSLYGLDAKRAECHARLCEVYGINKENSRSVTDNLDLYADAVDMHIALLNLKTDKPKNTADPKSRAAD